MISFLFFTQIVPAPCCSRGPASGGEELSSLQLASPPVATRNGLARPVRTGAPLAPINFGILFSTNSNRRQQAHFSITQFAQQPSSKVNLMLPLPIGPQPNPLPAEGFS